MTISRMQQPRQQYGLGSFVKKIGKKLKKVAKSPLGKAALAVGIGSLIPGAGFGGKFNTAKSLFGGVGKKLFGSSLAGGGEKIPGLLGKLGLVDGFGSKSLTGLGKIAAIGLPSIIAGMGAPKEGEDGLSDSGDRKEGLANYLRYYFKNLNPNAKQSEIDEFVKVNTYADGGRVNYGLGSTLGKIDYDTIKAIAAPATPPKDLTRPATDLPGGGGGTTRPVTLPDFAAPGEIGGELPNRPITNLPGGPGTGIDERRPMPEQSEGDKLYQDVLDYLKSDSNQIEAKQPEAIPMPFDPVADMLGSEKDSSLQILKERGYDTDKMNFMEGDFGLLEAVKASGEVNSAKELFDKGFLDKQYSFKDLYGNMDLLDKVKNLYMDKIFMPSYTGPSIGDTKIGFKPDFGNNTGGDDEYIDGINYQSKIKQRLADGGRIGYGDGGRKTFTDYLRNLGMDIEALDIDTLTIMQKAFQRDEGEPVMSDREDSAYGGRMGYNEGAPEMGMMASAPDLTDSINELALELFGKPIELLTPEEMDLLRDESERLSTKYMANGGMIRTGFAMGSKPEQNAMQAAGIEGLMLNQNPAGVTELDLRETGGFIPPVGAKEKADDIPAMLANNEFVFTADAVRGMGDGDVNEGAQRMYDMMKKLEKGGRV